MTKRLLAGVASTLLFCGLVLAQEDPAGDAVQQATREAQTRVEQMRERLLRAARLPDTAEDSREAGATDEQVKEILESAREQEVSAAEVQEILEAENEALRAGANPGEFGAAVQDLKSRGLRGRELAEAIHAEQIARGMKKPHPRGGPPGRAKGHDRGSGEPGEDDGSHDSASHESDDSEDSGPKGQGRGEKPKKKEKGENR